MLLSKLARRSFGSGHLLTWGETTHGWGRPTNSNYYTPGFVGNFSDIVSVSTGQYHLGFITKDNGVYTVGLDQDGRLGHSSSSSTSSTDTELPRRIAFNEPNTSISAISCGTRHSLALTADGAVYTWGFGPALGIPSPNDGDVPIKIPQEHFQDDKIVGVAAGKDFSVALGSQGGFYAWGLGLDALPGWEFSSAVPQASKEVAHFLGKRHAKIKKFTAIDQFILLLLDNGRIYGYGKNKAGVFGARTNPLVLSDLELKSFSRTHDALYKNEKIVDFEASSTSLIFRTETDRIFYNGMYDKYQPTPFPLEVQARKIFATDSSVGVIATDNKVYFLNDQFIEDSEALCKTKRLFEVEDPNFTSDVLDIGGAFSLRYALIK